MHGGQLYEVAEAVAANNVRLHPILGDKIPSNSRNGGAVVSRLPKKGKMVQIKNNARGFNLDGGG